MYKQVFSDSFEALHSEQKENEKDEIEPRPSPLCPRLFSRRFSKNVRENVRESGQKRAHKQPQASRSTVLEQLRSAKEAAMKKMKSED